MKPLHLILAAAAIALGYWLYRRSRLPSNFNALTSAQQAQYLDLLDRADAYTGPTE